MGSLGDQQCLHGLRGARASFGENPFHWKPRQQQVALVAKTASTVELLPKALVEACVGLASCLPARRRRTEIKSLELSQNGYGKGNLLNLRCPQGSPQGRPDWKTQLFDSRFSRRAGR